MSRKLNNFPKAEEKEVRVELPRVELQHAFVGETDQNLRTVEQSLDVRIGRDGEALLVRGLDSDVELAADLLEQIRGLLEGGETLFPGDLERAIEMLSADRKARLEDLFRDQVKIAGRRYNIVPKTFTQKRYIESMKAHDVVFGVGPAGTGKTYLAMAMAVAALMRREVKRVVLCRPAVEAGEKLGFLPGDMAEKVNPYLRPLYDALHDMVDFERAREMVERGSIEVAPLAFMRGRTLSSSFVVLDEAQNTTPGQMKMLLTRLGQHSKCVVTGDITQIDLPRGTMSGLREALRILKEIDGIDVIEFSGSDVIRHQLVAKIVAAYEQDHASKRQEAE